MCCKRILPYLAAVLLGLSGTLQAARVSDIASTVHNLSASGTGPVTATTESQICVFCHTPHAAESIPKGPLWNRKLSGSTYQFYGSSSMDSPLPAQSDMGTGSKLCLSCHDGTLALGSVNVLEGQENVTVDLSGTGAGGEMPGGAGVRTGFTRNLGTDLRNDHPISFVYDSTLANRDGELWDPALVSHIGNRAPGYRPAVPLESDQVECISCHDPHIRDTDPTRNIKFLRLNRFQQGTPSGGNFDVNNDIVCLACHDKLGTAWSQSAHADPTVANELYTDSAANLREFPLNSQVWEIACLNCHDTHTVDGSRRLLREGTDSTSTPKSGGKPAIEETCYQCHSADGGVLQGQGSAGFSVPDVKTDFGKLRHMPIRNSEQITGTEQHDILDANLVETPNSLGKGNLNNRHAECTDCHNPHRVIKTQRFNGTGGNTVATHEHDPNIQHSNIASGVLRGINGVEPLYGSAAWGSVPSQYLLKQGDGGLGAITDVSSSYVTREYQVCLKCHSDYAYDVPPNLGDSGGGTPPGTNDLFQYTNQAMEFQAPSGDRGEPGGNHRSWHPVLDSTGRTLTVRDNASSGIFTSPWNGSGGAYIGNLTMYCSDCHGSATANGTSEPSGGPDGNPWGPHGSTKDFILKGDWNNETGTGQQDDLCFKCHNYDDYANPGNTAPNRSGFNGSGGGMGGGGMGGGGGGGGGCMLSFASTNLHIGHARRIGRMECSWCHAAVPHGWKNKALLVDISQEGGRAPYTSGPYYMQAMLGGGGAVNWASSGNWSSGSCGGRMWMMRSCGNPP